MADFSRLTHKFRLAEASPHDLTHKISKRNRQPVSCSACRSRKLKCDRGHPCETCVKRGEGHSCSYGSSLKSPANSEANSRNGKARDRLQLLEDLVKQMMNSTEITPGMITTGSTISDRSKYAPAPQEVGDGHLRLEGNESKYVGSTHWSAILDNLHELKSVITSEEMRSEVDASSHDISESDTLFGASTPPTLENIIQGLPPRVQVDRRLAKYFQATYLILPIVHTYQFQRQYEQFWQNPLSAPPLWLAIMFSILCMSATLSEAVGSEPPTPENIPSPRENFLTAAAQCLILGGYTRPKQYVVEALMLFTQCKYMATLDPSREVSIVFSIIVRLAFRMGYHRDPDFFPRISKFEGEMRRRTWAMCKQFDLMVAFQLGLPSNIPDDSYDTRPPSNLLDADFDENFAVLPPSRPETESTQILYFVVKTRLMTVFGKICHHALSLKPTPEGEVMELDSEVRQAYESIPPPLRIRPMTQSFAQPAHIIMVRVNCEFLFQKSICVLHRKRMTQGVEYSRHACTKAAVAILEYLVDLHKEFQPGGQLHADRWMLSSFTMSDFLLAAVILCLTMSQKHDGNGVMNGGNHNQNHMELLRQSYFICLDMGDHSKEANRVAHAVGAMLEKVMPGFQASSPLEPPNFVEVASSNLDPALVQTTADVQTWADDQRREVDYVAALLGGPDPVDWTYLDQYILDTNPFEEYGHEWASTPVPGMGGIAFGMR